MGTAVARGGEVSITGVAAPELAPFDELLVSLIKSHKIPGAALAVLDQGRLLLARGYGWADREAGLPVQPTSLFRIASVSKPITSLAVLQLVEQGRLALDDRVLDLLPRDLTPLADHSRDPRWEQITVADLLRHTGGFDRDVSSDPMFMSVEIAQALAVRPPAMPSHILRYMAGRPLDFTPGERFAYSNFGYSLLGRIIERTTGSTYEAHLQTALLQPLGIHGMRLGGSQFAARQPSEVRYYDEQHEFGPSVFADDLGHQVPQPYGAWCVEAFDAHGGWLANVVDLARLAAALDAGSSRRPLSAQTWDQVHARSAGLAGWTAQGEPSPTYCGLGWFVRPVAEGGVNLWHTGSIPGTATLLVLRHDGKSWAVLFNTRAGPDLQHLGRVIDPLLHAAAAKVKEWPQVDLFERF